MNESQRIFAWQPAHYARCDSAFNLFQTFAAAQAMLVLVTSLSSFIRVVFNKQINFGKYDSVILVSSYGIPATVSLVLVGLDWLGPSGFWWAVCVYCADLINSQSAAVHKSQTHCLSQNRNRNELCEVQHQETSIQMGKNLSFCRCHGDMRKNTGSIPFTISSSFHLVTFTFNIVCYSGIGIVLVNTKRRIDVNRNTVAFQKQFSRNDLCPCNQ